MIAYRRNSRLGFGAGLLLAFLVMAALGAGYVAAPVTPKYAVQFAGEILCITNNETDQLFIYENTEKGPELKSILELEDTGKKMIRGKIVESEKKQNDQSRLTPGTSHRVTVDLEAEVSEVFQDSVSLRVTASEDVEQGVPMMTKLPYTNRVFKNTGVSARDKKVTITIPKDRIRASRALRDQQPEQE